MSEKVSYYEGADQFADGVLGQSYYIRTPLEEVMEREEEDEQEAADEEKGGLLTGVLTFAFCDEQPMDWRFAARRGVVLLQVFAPGLLIGRSTREVQELDGLKLPGRFSPQELVARETPERLRKLLQWVYEDNGKAWVTKGTRKLYVLALGYYPQALKKTQPGGMVKRKWRDERQVDMTLADFAEAFGEEDDSSSRARWQARAKQILAGTPHVPFQKSQETAERCREAARGNRNRRGGG